MNILFTLRSYPRPRIKNYNLIEGQTLIRYNRTDVQNLNACLKYM